MSLRFPAAIFLLATWLFLGNSAFADNDPTLHQVYSTVQAGRLDEAQRMMDKVLSDHPNSAKAHYVEAQILAQQGQMAGAASELNTAERLEPGLPFANPQAAQSLRNLINNHGSVANHGGGFPWLLLLLGMASIVIIALIVRAMNARNPSVFPAGAQPGLQPMYGPQPYGPMSPNTMGGGMGSTIMGGLATGAAVGAGMVAGEALAHHFMDDGNATSNPVMPMADMPDGNLGGTDFGINDGSSWDDNSGFADSGGDDWS